MDDQQHHHTEFDSFCRQITESAISDDGKNFPFFNIFILFKSNLFF